MAAILLLNVRGRKEKNTEMRTRADFRLTLFSYEIIGCQLNLLSHQGDQQGSPLSPLPGAETTPPTAHSPAGGMHFKLALPQVRFHLACLIN